MRDIIIQTLMDMRPTLQKLHDDYYIIGGSALILQGVPLKQTHDIDIFCSTRDVDFLIKEWKNYYIPSPKMKDEGLFLSRFAQFQFPKMEVEAQGDLQVCKKGHWEALAIHSFRFIDLDGMQVKVPTLQEMIQILEFFGRTKDFLRIQEIKNYLKE